VPVPTGLPAVAVLLAIVVLLRFNAAAAKMPPPWAAPPGFALPAPPFAVLPAKVQLVTLVAALI
jgi:hypothetical protein